MVPILLFVILGIVQGVLEWLPVSSEGQTIFIGSLFGITDQSLLLSIAFWLHFGTMLSVLIIFRKEWIQICNLKNSDFNYLRKFLIITTLGTAILGIPIKIFLLDVISGDTVGIGLMIILAVALIFTAILLKFQEHRDKGHRNLDSLSSQEMFVVGLAQGLTIIPGVSRSGTTVTALLLFNVEGDDSFRGSFFMSVPAVLGAITLDLFDYFRGESTSVIIIDPIGILIAIIFAAIFGIFTIKILLKFAQEVDFSNIVLIISIFVILYILILVFLL